MNNVASSKTAWYIALIIHLRMCILAQIWFINEDKNTDIKHDSVNVGQSDVLIA